MLRGCFRQIHIGTLIVGAVMFFMGMAMWYGGGWLFGAVAVFMAAMLFSLLDKNANHGYFKFFSPLLHLLFAVPLVMLIAVVFNKLIGVLVVAAILILIEFFQAMANGGKHSVYFPNPLDTFLDLAFGAGGIWIALKLVA